MFLQVIWEYITIQLLIWPGILNVDCYDVAILLESTEESSSEKSTLRSPIFPSGFEVSVFFLEPFIILTCNHVAY